MSAVREAETPKRAPRNIDDMHDAEGDLAAPSPLGPFLKLCDPCANGETTEPCLRADFDDADDRALDAQRDYGRATRNAARFGLGALLLGLFQEFFGRSHSQAPFPTAVRWALFVVEVAYTGTTLVLVLLAISDRRKEEWLSERFKAERLRLLKFKLLIDPRLWGRDARYLPQTRGLLETGRHDIVNQPDDVLHAFKASDALPELARTEDCNGVDVPALQRLLDYYRRKRLDHQRVYFEGRLRRKRGFTENASLSPIFFFTGIALSLCYLILEFATHKTESALAEAVGRVLLFFSFAFPLGWAAIRTVKSAHQLSRNRLRSNARHADLSKIEGALNAETSRPPEKWDRPLIFGYLTTCEGVLSADQHEWIRLMVEAEWYG
jgi:hypothetical protein